MSTISSRVTAWIDTHPLHAAFLTDGLINLSALARLIQPELQKQSSSPISRDAVTLALHRLSKKTPRTAAIDQNKAIKEIAIQSNLALIYFPLEKLHAEAFSKAITILHNTSEYALYSRGVSNIALLAKPPIVTELSAHFSFSHHIQELIAITFRLGTSDELNDARAYILQRIASCSSTVHEVFSSQQEFTVVVNQSDTHIVNSFVTR